MRGWVKMKSKFIEECFKKLGERNPSIYHFDIEKLEKKYHVSKELVAKQLINKTTKQWELMDSTVDDEDIRRLEKKFNITFPRLYKEFISSYAHLITILTCKVDNDFFEDEDVILEIPVQPYQKELDDIYTILEGSSVLLEAGYLPIGECNTYGILCIDLVANDESEMKIIFFDHEDICECTTREELEEVGYATFDNFKQLLGYFFLNGNI